MMSGWGGMAGYARAVSMRVHVHNCGGVACGDCMHAVVAYAMLVG